MSAPPRKFGSRKGCYFDRRSQRWHAFIRIRGGYKQRLGPFWRLEDAQAARAQAEAGWA